MSYEIYTPDLSDRNEISHAISIRESVCYNDIGTISMWVDLDDYNIKNIKNESVLLDKSNGATFFIVKKQIDTIHNQIVINGHTSNAILNQRVIAEKKKFKNVEKDVYDFITANLRGLPNIQTAPLKGLTETVDSEILDGQLLDKVRYVLNLANMGHRMVWDDDTRSWNFEVFKGTDHTQGNDAVIFSYETGEAQNLVITDDVSDFKTTFYISGKTTDDRRIIEIFGDEKTGMDRREKWVREVPQQDGGITEEEFRAQLRSKAEAAAIDYMRAQNFSVEIDPSDFGTKYNLGDLVTCVSTTFDVQFNKRISQVQYTHDLKGSKTSLVLGEPNINLKKELKRHGSY